MKKIDAPTLIIGSDVAKAQPTEARIASQLRPRATGTGRFTLTVPADQLLPDSLYAALPVNNVIDGHVYEAGKDWRITIDYGKATIIRILSNMYADCRPRLELYTNYSIDTIVKNGITTGNLCSDAHLQAKPGELILYEIPKTYIPTMTNPPANPQQNPPNR